MNLVTIYSDEDKTIQMPKTIVDKFNIMLNEHFTLKKEEMEDVLDKCFEYISTIEHESLAGKNAITSSDVPILSRGKIFELSNYGILFEDAVLLLSEYFDRTKGRLTLKWKSEIEELIRCHYSLSYNTPCIVHLFDENYLGVTGFMAIIKKDIIIIYYVYLNEEDKFQTFPF